MADDSSSAVRLHLSLRKDRLAVCFVLVIALYFLAQLLVRINLSDSLELDEAEQALEFQHIRMGYGTQPPLYNWLQWLMFSAFGLNLFSLSLLKNLLLFATYFNMFLLARLLVGTACAIAVSASMFLLPQIGWESQRDLTHSVLLTTIACTSLCVYFSLLRRPTALRYAVFGLLIGLGMQTKYNFAIFTFGVMAASLLVPQHREIVWNRNSLLAIAVAVLCFLPHGLWVLNNLQMAAGGTLAKLASYPNDSYIMNVASGLSSTLLAAVSFVTPLWLIYLVLCRPYLKQATLARQNPDAVFFLWLYAAYFGLIFIMVFAGEVSRIKDRWMQPILFTAPLVFFLLFPALAQVKVLRRILQVAGVAAVCILTALPLRVYLGPTTGKLIRAHYPFPALATELTRRFPEIDTVVTSDQPLAGNVHFHRPQLHTLMLDDLQIRPVALHGEVLLVMPEDDSAEWLPVFHSLYPQVALIHKERITLPYRYGGKGVMTYDVLRFVMSQPSHL
jgi:4-amino-4-deoxy-L-arabinose transferase-like glycosyltransferase